VAKRSVRSFIGGKERRGNANDNGDDGRKKDRWKVEIQRGKEAEKCSAVLVDRHALKKITVSTGILRKKEQIGEQVRKDTPGSQRDSLRAREVYGIPECRASSAF